MNLYVLISSQQSQDWEKRNNQSTSIQCCYKCWCQCGHGYCRRAGWVYWWRRSRSSRSRWSSFSSIYISSNARKVCIIDNLFLEIFKSNKSKWYMWPHLNTWKDTAHYICLPSWSKPQKCVWLQSNLIEIIRIKISK